MRDRLQSSECARYLKAMADPERLKIVQCLQQGPRIVAIATSAVREARNRERLLDPLRRREGIEVQVLSGRDEARFGVVAALESLSFRNGVVADLGGASLQLSRVRNRRVISTASLPLGAVRTTERFFKHDPPTPRELRALRAEIRARLHTALPSAELVIEDVPLVAYCPACAVERPLASPQELCCPACGTPTPEVVRDRELEVFALEIEP